MLDSAEKHLSLWLPGLCEKIQCLRTTELLISCHLEKDSILLTKPNNWDLDLPLLPAFRLLYLPKYYLHLHGKWLKYPDYLTTLRYARNFDSASCYSLPSSCDITGNVKIELCASDVARLVFWIWTGTPIKSLPGFVCWEFPNTVCKLQTCKWESEVWIYANGIENLPCYQTNTEWEWEKVDAPPVNPKGKCRHLLLDVYSAWKNYNQ